MDERNEFNFDEISIYCIVRDILKNLWVILLAAAAAWFAVTGGESLLYVPEYTASATLAVSAKGNNSSAYSSLSVTNQMAGVFSEVFDSNVLRQKIQEELGQDSMEGEITSSIIEETNLIVLQVTSVNPRQAYLIIQSAIHNYDTVSDYLFSNAVLRIVQEPQVPFSPSNVINISRIQKLAMLGAAGITGIFLVLFSVLRFTVKTKQAARRNLDGRILETIPYEKKRKTLKEYFRKTNKSILVSSSLVSMRFSEAVRKSATQIDHHMRKRNQKVLLISSVSENEGKSSAAANLALALAEKGRKVILIDSDLKKPAQFKIFDKHKEVKKNLTDYLDGKLPAGELLEYDKKHKIFFIFQNKAVHNSGKYLDSAAMRELVQAAKKSVDYIVLDSSPMALSSDGELLLKLADAAVLVVRQDWTDIRAVNDTADNIRQTGVDFTGFILNIFHEETPLKNRGTYGYYGYRHRRKTAEEEESA